MKDTLRCMIVLNDPAAYYLELCELTNVTGGQVVRVWGRRGDSLACRRVAVSSLAPLRVGS